MSGNFFDQFDEAPKSTDNFFDQFDEESTATPKKVKKPFTGRGTIAARNAAAAVQPLSERGTEFQRYAAIDANTVPSLGTAESRDRFSAEVARKAGEMGINPELSGLSPEVRASMERVAPSGQLLPLVRNPGVVAAKFRQGWRGMDAGLAALEYNITGRITVGDNTGDALERSIGGGPTVLEGAEAEKYLRELSSPNEDDVTARAFDTVSSMGTRAAANAFAQPESILSLVGGMFGGGWGSAAGMLPTAVKALGSEYQQNLKMGATHQAAFANALAKMGVEGGTEWLGGKYGGSGGPIQSIASESGEEALAQVGGYGADALSGLLANNGTPFYEKIPKTFGKALEETAEAAATGGIAAGALRAITAAPAFVVSGAQAAQDMLKSKRATAPSAVPRPKAAPMFVDPWVDRATAAPIAVPATTPQTPPPIVPPAAPQTPSGVPPATTSTLLQQIMTPEQLALHESLQDEAGRMKMLADIKADAEAKRAGHDKKRAAMARNAEDTAWLAANPITSHPMFGEIDKAIRGGATSHALLKEKVPHLSGVVQRAAFTHLESIGVIGPYVKGKKREILQPQAAPTAAPAASGTVENSIVPTVQPSIKPPVQSAIQPTIPDNIVEQEPNVTLPEVERIIARETEDVNTPPVTPTADVQTTTPKAGSYQPVAGGYESRVTAHTLGSNALDPTADAGALIYEYRKKGDSAPAMTMVVGKSGKLIPAIQAAGADSKSTGEAWIPPTKEAGDAVRALLLNRGNLDAKGRAENNAQIAAIVAPRIEPTKPIRLRAPAQQTATLPPALAGAKPRYGFGSNNHQLEFASDVDRAAYVLAQTKPSKQDAAYLAFVMGATGMSEVEARAYGAKVREGIKQQAKPLTKPGTIVVPDGRAAPAPVEASVTPQEPITPVPTTPVAAAVVESTVAPPVQAQTPVEEAPLPTSIGKAGVEAAPPKPAIDTWVASADPEDVDIWKGTHDAHAKRNNVKPEDTYVGQVLRGITPTATPTADDATFAEKMKLSIPTEQPGAAATQVPEDTVPAPTTETAPIVPPAKQAKEPSKSKTVRDLEKKAAERAAAQAKAEQVAKDDAAREALKMPSDAELVGAGLSPAEVTLLKKNPEQHRDVLDAVSRGEISTKEGMRPVTDADVTAAKTRPEKDKLQRLKDKYEQVTDAPRKLSPASITNVRKEAIARAYERIKLIAQSPNMGQFDAIPNDPESTKAILGLQAEAQKTPTTEAELAKKLEEQYVENYTRNHPEVKKAAASPVAVDMPGFAASVDIGAALRSIADTLSGKQTTQQSAPVEKPLTDTENGVGSLNRIGDAIVGLARNRGIASPEAQDMIEARSGLIEAMRVEAESAIEQVKQEMVDALRGASKATRETYKENLLKYLNGDTTVPLPAALKARIAELRKLIDDRSLALIALGLVEKDKIATVLENIGKWTHRDFKVFNLQPGRNNHPGEYKKLVMKLAKQGRRDIVKEVIGDIVEAMRVPDVTTLKGLIKAAKDKKHKDHEDAKATIDTWARRWRLAYTTTPKELHAKLLAISAMDEAELKRHAVEYANYLLDPEHENAPAEVREDFNRFKAIYADDTALTKDRTQVPPWLKKLWGEYSDWETIGLLSLENQAQILAKYTTLSRYKAILLASGRAFKSDSNRSKVGYSLLEGKSYGPLNGYYIPSTDLWLIQSANTVNALDVALGARERGGNSLQATVRRMAAGTVAVTSAVGSPFKVAAVLMNHTTVLINAGISALFLAGTVPRIMSSLKAIPNGFKIARSSSFADVGIRTARTGPFKGVGMIGRALENGTELQRQLLFLVANNVLHDAALSADMKRKTQEQLTQEVDAMLTFSTRLAKYYANPFHYYRYLKDRTSRLNSAGDEFGKYIMWASRVENLMAIDPQMSQVDAELLAAKQTVATMPSFMKAWPISRIIGNSGLIDPFLTFNTDQLRNIYNSAAIAVEYGLTKKGRAAKMYAASEAVSILVRLGAISTYNAIAAAPLLAIMQVASDMLDGGGDDDEDKKKEEEAQIAAGMKWNTGEKYELIRSVLPGHIHGGVQILRQLEDGKLVLTSGQRFDPSLAGALLEAAMYGDDESFEGVLKDAFFQLTPTLPALGDLASGTFNYLSEETGSAAKDDAADEFAKGLGKLGESYTPGTWKTMMRTAKAADQGVELTLREKILNNVGMTVQIFDPARTAAKIAADYDNTHSRSMRLVREQMKEEAETLDFHSATVSKFTIWERAQRKMNNLRKVGLLDEGAIYTAVKSAPMSEGITEAEMVGLVEGMFVLPKYSEQVEKFHKEALVKAGTDQAKLDKVNTLYQTYYKQAAEADKAERAIYKAMGVTVL